MYWKYLGGNMNITDKEVDKQLAKLKVVYDDTIQLLMEFYESKACDYA
jgi:hypothetical protein